MSWIMLGKNEMNIVYVLKRMHLSLKGQYGFIIFDVYLSRHSKQQY